MEDAMEAIVQEYLRYKRTVQKMEEELQQLPVGGLTYRTVYGHRYCYIQFRDAQGARHSNVVAKSEIENVQQIFARRDYLKQNIKIYQSHIQYLEKRYPQFVLLSTLPQQPLTIKDAQKPYHTHKGDYVRSKSELIIANELYNHQLSYEYEKPLLLDGYTNPFRPDFTICTPRENATVYWEHCGLMSDSEYRNRWERKKQLYAHNGISEWQKNLIITYEAQSGDFSVEDIQQHIAQLLRR